MIGGPEACAKVAEHGQFSFSRLHRAKQISLDLYPLIAEAIT